MSALYKNVVYELNNKLTDTLEYLHQNGFIELVKQFMIMRSMYGDNVATAHLQFLKPEINTILEARNQKPIDL